MLSATAFGLGLSTAMAIRPPQGGYSWTSGGENQLDARLGHVVASAGDVNGDGYADVIVGAPWFDHVNAENAGRAYVFHGSPSGLSDTPSWVSSGDAQYGALFGWSVASAGDVDKDGFGDVVVGAPRHNTQNPDVGKVYLYCGSESGLSSTPSWTSSGDDQLNRWFFGFSVASAGDVNGDGHSDVIVGAGSQWDAQPGKAFVYLGSDSGLSPMPIWTATGDAPTIDLGISVASAGDVNKDGFADILVGVRGVWGGLGRAHVYLGSPSGPSFSPSWTSYGDSQNGSLFGRTVAGVGDVNGDGYSDIAVGAYGFNTENPDAGKVYVYHGSAQGPSSSPSWTSSGENVNQVYFGWSLAGAGDFNGDSFCDLIVGAYETDSPASNAGTALVFLGSPSGLASTPALSLGGAGHVWAEFGWSVAGAGDVDKDGASDLIVGAPSASSDAAGRVFAYYGTPPERTETTAEGPTVSPMPAATGTEDQGGGGGACGCLGVEPLILLLLLGATRRRRLQ